jgi:hypothetical protein
MSVVVTTTLFPQSNKDICKNESPVHSMNAINGKLFRSDDEEENILTAGITILFEKIDQFC